MSKAISYHTISKIIVVFTAYILHFCLGKYMTVEEYGIVGTIITFSNFYYLFLTNGVRQSISKMISMDRYDTREVIKKGMTMQLLFGLTLGVLNYALAPIFAKLLGNTAFTQYFREVSFLIPLTALYFGFTGGLNGMKLFKKEAIVTIIYPVVRLSAILFIHNFKNNKPQGVIIGFISASFVTAVVAGIFVKMGTKKHCATIYAKRNQLKYREIMQSVVDFVIFFAMITLIMNMDTFFVQAITNDTKQTGLYTGVCTFSLVPYYLISAFYLVILPYITEYYNKGLFEKVQNTIKNMLKIILITVLPIAIIISVSSKDLLVSFYSSEYEKAAATLSILAIGIFSLSMLAVFSVILNAIEKKKITRILAIVLLIVDIILQCLLVSKYGILGAAISTSVISVIGCIISYVAIYKNIGKIGFIKECKKLILVVSLFTIGAYFIFHAIEVTNIFILAGIYILFGITYLSVMFGFHLISIKELKNL